MKSGFSLLELMIVLVIASALAAIAYPYWAQHQATAQRLEAEIYLTKLASALEQYYINNNTYDNASIEKLGLQPSIARGTYLLKIESLDSTDFTLTAEPQGRQAVLDLGCGTLTLDSAGEQGIRGRGQMKDCWA